VLVVGCVHGNECAALPVVRALARAHAREDIWLVGTANPDGTARDTRANANGVDLNRNFASGWRRSTTSGARPFSEPETRALRALVRRVRPRVTIWFHQPQGVVRAWGRSLGVARRYARLSGMRFRALRWPPGSASNWQNHLPGGGTSFVVELPAGPLSPAAVARHAAAVEQILP
jgi:protein MpaA